LLWSRFSASSRAGDGWGASRLRAAAMTAGGDSGLGAGVTRRGAGAV
jgi:hypothetical protein